MFNEIISSIGGEINDSSTIKPINLDLWSVELKNNLYHITRYLTNKSHYMTWVFNLDRQLIKLMIHQKGLAVTLSSAKWDISLIPMMENPNILTFKSINKTDGSFQQITFKEVYIR